MIPREARVCNAERLLGDGLLWKASFFAEIPRKVPHSTSTIEAEPGETQIPAKLFTRRPRPRRPNGNHLVFFATFSRPTTPSPSDTVVCHAYLPTYLVGAWVSTE